MKVAHIDRVMSLKSLGHPVEGGTSRPTRQMKKSSEDKWPILKDENMDRTHWENFLSAFSHVLSWAPS